MSFEPISVKLPSELVFVPIQEFGSNPVNWSFVKPYLPARLLSDSAGITL